LGAIEMQLLCPLHLSLSMMIFISPPIRSTRKCTSPSLPKRGNSDLPAPQGDVQSLAN
jgi:hypothetical protein